MKKEIISNLVIAVGLSLIFGVATHRVIGGFIVGGCYFLASLIIIKNKKK